jgi:hypothetical protein
MLIYHFNLFFATLKKADLLAFVGISKCHFALQMGSQKTP